MGSLPTLSKSTNLISMRKLTATLCLTLTVLLVSAAMSASEVIIEDNAIASFRRGLNSEVGKSAVTDYRIIDIAGRKVSWLLLTPRTGRTHQLRVHCALMSTPIIGDKKYGSANKILDGTPHQNSLHLHAKSITLPHPAGGNFSVSAPLPPNMQATWDFFGFDTHVKGAE